ncbi:MAG: AAA family ATPase [Actinomycetales bacterium]
MGRSGRQQAEPVAARPIRRLDFQPPPDPELDVDLGAWPFSVPAVAQVVREGLELAPGVTFLVGENGSGKSTLVEAVAQAVGLNPEGGSAGAQHATRASESPLGRCLRPVRSAGAARWGFFLRAETMHGFYTYLEQHPSTSAYRGDPRFHELSHGESFLALLDSRFDSPGFYCLDEPEAALSFSSTLALVGVLADLTRRGAQVLCATHSPVLAALPGATILEVGEWGLRPRAWEDLELVDHWRRYLAEPRRYLRHVLDE